jgi:alpha-galactosidase
MSETQQERVLRPDRAIVRNDRVIVEVQTAKSQIDIREIGSERSAFSISDASVVLVDGRRFSTQGSRLDLRIIPIEDDLGAGTRLIMQPAAPWREAKLEVELTLYDEHPFVVIQCSLSNLSAEPMRVSAYYPLDSGGLDLGSPPETWRFYKHGWQSWSPTVVLDCAGEDVAMAPPVIGPGMQPEAREGRFVSEMMTAIVSPESGLAVVAGFVTAGAQMSQVWLDRKGGTLTAASYADGITVPPGGRLASERLLIEPTRGPLEAMEHYGDALGRSMGARPSAEVASGWCSWYYYWQRVTEEAVLANLEELKRKGRYALPMEYVQIDDGWQAAVGDWLDVNEKFPHGLKWLVERIHEAGFRAGLWLAPFLIGEKSRLRKEHPEWAVQYRPGKPHIAMQNWGQDCYALDLTRPEVIEWLKIVFRAVCDEWGFNYVKIDFVYAGAVDGIRQYSEVTRAQAYRRGLEAIREAAGERFILGCGNLMGASVGLVDGARISPDVAPFWEPAGRARDPERSRMSQPSALNAIRNTINRWWMHGRLWQNDPDCLLARDSETALTPDEVRTLAMVIAMSGGMVLDSDDLTRLSDERRELLSLLLPPYGKAARPLDLFESDMPRLLELDVGSHRMLAVFNWGEEAAEVEAPLADGSVRVFDAWGRGDLGVHEGSMAVEVPAHGCRLLAVRAVEETRAPDERGLPQLFRWSRLAGKS